MVNHKYIVVELQASYSKNKNCWIQVVSEYTEINDLPVSVLWDRRNNTCDIYRLESFNPSKIRFMIMNTNEHFSIIKQIVYSTEFLDDVYKNTFFNAQDFSNNINKHSQRFVFIQNVTSNDNSIFTSDFLRELT